MGKGSPMLAYGNVLLKRNLPGMPRMDTLHSSIAAASALKEKAVFALLMLSQLPLCLSYRSIQPLLDSTGCRCKLAPQ